jgi:hypothetical protein
VRNQMKIMMMIIVIAILFIPQVFAVPDIISIDGQVMHEENITITGSGFGTKQITTPLIIETFEPYSVGQMLNTITAAGSPLIYDSNNPSSDPNPSVISASPLSRPGKSAHFTYVRGTGYGLAKWLYKEMPILTTSRHIMLDAWVYATVEENWTEEDNLGGPQLKVFGFVNGAPYWNSTAGTGLCQQIFVNGSTQWANSLHEHHPYRAGTNNATTFATSSYGSPVVQNDGQWSHIRYYLDTGEFDVSAPPYTGSSKLYRGNILVQSAAVQWYQTGFTGRINGFRAGSYTGNTATSHVEVYWDNIYVDNSWARVEIGNNQNYALSTHTEIQIPHTTWNDSTIQFTVNLGNFNTSEQLYLFVVDEGGVASEGFPLAMESVPTITSVSGTLSHGNNITLTGSGFGIKNPVEPVLWDSIDNQHSYSGLVEGQTIPTGDDYPWATNGNYDYVGSLKYGISNPRILGKPYYHTGMINATPPSYIGYLGFQDLGEENPKQLYINWWFRVNGNMASGSGGTSSTKLVRAWSDFTGQNGRISWCADQEAHYTWNGTAVVPQGSWHHWGGVEDGITWNKLEFAVDSNGIGSNAASFKSWTNGQPIFNVANLGTPSESDSINYLYVLGFDPNYGNSLDNVFADFTEIYIDTTFARIDICNSSNWTAYPKHCEIQIPHTTWNDSTIQFTANLGSFNASEQLYLFVVDENGNASNGYPITLGQPPQSSCPSHDTNGNSIIEASEIGTALSDWLSGQFTINQIIQLMAYFKRGTCA